MTTIVLSALAVFWAVCLIAAAMLFEEKNSGGTAWMVLLMLFLTLGFGFGAGASL